MNGMILDRGVPGSGRRPWRSDGIDELSAAPKSSISSYKNVHFEAFRGPERGDPFRRLERRGCARIGARMREDWCAVRQFARLVS